jgi:hypothetical protein
MRQSCKYHITGLKVMSQQNVTTKPATDEPEAAANPPVGGKRSPGEGDRSFSVDSYADRLMDELFEEMDHVLEGGRLPTQVTPPPEPISLKSIQVPQIVLPPSLLPQADVKTVEPETKETEKQKSGRLLDRLLLGGACVSLVTLVGLLLWNRGDLQRFWTLVTGETTEQQVAPKTPEQLKAEADAKFMEYMRRSLAAMQFEGEEAPIPTPPPAVQQNQTLPIPMTPPPVNVTVNPTINNQPDSGNLTEVLNRIAIALERLTLTGAPPTQTVKVPANPPAEDTTAAAPKPGAAPSSIQAAAPKPGAAPANTQSANAGNPAPAPAPSPKPEAEAPKPAPAAPEQAVASVPKPEAAPPLPEQPAETLASAQTEAAPTAGPSSSQSGAVHTLVGIIEVGERSVALFEIDGASRRINIGESIGSSGWTLGEIKNKEAVIRRNGEVRSIYVGQSI